MPETSSPASILVVEDDAAVREAITDVLADAGYIVTAAGNGADALRYLRSGPRPCLIFLDLMMPIMTGWEFASLLERDPDLAGTPIVVVSAIASFPHVTERLRVAAVLPKPFTADEVIAIVEHYCP